LIVWVSGLDEHNAPAHELRRYRLAISAASARGQQVFGLYGGFFSVLLGIQGLSGAAHGVGFSEHRNWRELPQSGAPPARYYLPTAHRYVAQDLAQAMWEQDPSLTGCTCSHCDGRPPITLDYHELMKHSVYCRAAEISGWYGKDSATSASDLLATHVEMTEKIAKTSLAPRIKSRAYHSIEHLPTWAEALDRDDSA
jgi:hypothetical protein